MCILYIGHVGISKQINKRKRTNGLPQNWIWIGAKRDEVPQLHRLHLSSLQVHCSRSIAELYICSTNTVDPFVGIAAKKKQHPITGDHGRLLAVPGILFTADQYSYY